MPQSKKHELDFADASKVFSMRKATNNETIFYLNLNQIGYEFETPEDDD